MRNLSRIAFVIALAACGDTNNNLPLEGCELTPDTPECRCELTPSLPECQPVPDGEISGDSVLFYNDTGSAFVGAVYDPSGPLGLFISAEEDFLDSIDLGTCTDAEQEDSPGEPAFESMGNVRVERDGAVLLDLTPSAGNRYEDLIDAGVLNLGDELDVVTTGSSTVNANAFTSMFVLPIAFPAFDDLVDNTLSLAKTISFNTTGAQQTRFRINFLEGQTSVTLTCLASGNSFTFDDTTYDRMPATGSISMTASTTTFQPIETADGEPRTIRGVTSATKNVQYQKP